LPSSDREPLRTDRKSGESFAYDDLVKRDKVNLDTFWLRDESLEDSANLPDPDVLALEVAEELEAALERFGAIAGRFEALIL
jgi:type I restriction enzyme M protein